MDTKLARKILEKIKKNPENWDQQSYATKTSCGTAFCFAGHVVHEVFPDAMPSFVVQVNARATLRASSRFRLNGELKYYRDVAVNLLGINCREGVKLFHPGNNLDDLETLIEEAEKCSQSS